MKVIRHDEVAAKFMDEARRRGLPAIKELIGGYPRKVVRIKVSLPPVTLKSYVYDQMIIVVRYYHQRPGSDFDLEIIDSRSYSSHYSSGENGEKYTPHPHVDNIRRMCCPRWKMEARHQWERERVDQIIPSAINTVATYTPKDSLRVLGDIPHCHQCGIWIGDDPLYEDTTAMLGCRCGVCQSILCSECARICTECKAVVSPGEKCQERHNKMHGHDVEYIRYLDSDRLKAALEVRAKTRKKELS